MNINIGKLSKFKTINYVNNKYVVSWGLEKANNDPEDDTYKWKYFILDHKPSIPEIQEIINNNINEQVRKSIENNFYWNGMKIKLSIENQIDYKLLFDTTVLLNGTNLPEKVKFKANGENIYYEIDSLDEFKDLIINMNNHIRNCVKIGYNLKESINYEEYTI
jgi:hypothetical protein